MHALKWYQVVLGPVLISGFQFVAIQPAHAGCTNVQGNYGSSYIVCRTGSYMTLQGSNNRTGSIWSESCYGVGNSVGGCSGIDASGRFWSCNWMPYAGQSCYKSELVN